MQNLTSDIPVDQLVPGQQVVVAMDTRTDLAHAFGVGLLALTAEGMEQPRLYANGAGDARARVVATVVDTDPVAPTLAAVTVMAHTCAPGQPPQEHRARLVVPQTHHAHVIRGSVQLW